MSPVAIAITILLGAIGLVAAMIGKYVAGRQLQEFTQSTRLPMNVDRVIGAEGEVVAPVSRVSGQVEIDGETWEARTDGELPVGCKILVHGIDSTRLIVYQTSKSQGK